MSENQTERKIHFNGFDGIDYRKCHSGNENLYDIENFRITADGSIKKRCGYYLLCKMGSPILAVWSGTLNGQHRCFVIQKNMLFSFKEKTSTLSTVGYLNSFSGKPQFFFYRNSLYLYASPKFYKVSEDSVTPVLGYVPLYGKDWGTYDNGEINEPINILNGYARITYIVAEDKFTSFLPVGNHTILSVLYVYKNGVLLNSDEYQIDTRFNRIFIYDGLVPGDKLSACVALDVSEEQSKLFASTHQTVFGGINTRRLFMWGDSSTSPMFASAYVTKEQLAAAEADIPDCGSLYFPENHEFSVGDGRYVITSVCRHYDRLLIFTEGDVWMADSSACGIEEFPVMNINSSLGCSSPDGISSINNSPLTVWNNGVYLWSANTVNINECVANSISEAIENSLTPQYLKGSILFKNTHNNEIWLYNPSEPSNLWVYNIERKAWYRFTGIDADGFFELSNQVGFFKGNCIYKFSEDTNSDTNSENTLPIYAQITVKNLNFDSEESKRLSSITVIGDFDNSKLKITLTPNKGNSKILLLSPKEGHSIIQKRLASGRFSFLKEVKIEALSENDGSQTIHGFEISARQGRKEK